MKRIFSLFLCLCLLFCGCEASPITEETSPSSTSSTDESTAEPTPTASPTPAPTPAPPVFTYDPFKLSAESASVLELAGNTEDWNTLMQAVLSCETTCTLQYPDGIDDLLLVFSASPYADFTEVSYEGNALYITQTDSTAAETLKNAVETLMNDALLPFSDEAEKALYLYRTVSSFTYEESEENSLCRMLTEHKGGAKEFSEALQYLLTQADIFSFVAEGTAAGFPHYWVVVEFNGQYYHLDPVFEQSVTAGRGLSYFGMNDAAHLDTGCSAQYTVGLLNEPHDALCPDLLFDGLFTDVTNWQFDPAAHEITLTYGGGPSSAAFKLASLY